MALIISLLLTSGVMLDNVSLACFRASLLELGNCAVFLDLDLDLEFASS
jgi:hypothetical protein